MIRKVLSHALPRMRLLKMYLIIENRRPSEKSMLIFTQGCPLRFIFEVFYF